MSVVQLVSHHRMNCAKVSFGNGPLLYPLLTPPSSLPPRLTWDSNLPTHFALFAHNMLECWTRVLDESMSAACFSIVSAARLAVCCAALANSPLCVDCWKFRSLAAFLKCDWTLVQVLFALPLFLHLLELAAKRPLSLMTLTKMSTFSSSCRITLCCAYVVTALLIRAKIGYMWSPVHGSVIIPPSFFGVTLSKTLYSS